jgi:hypothetical protein
MIVTSPTILGEGCCCKPYKWWGKDDMLDDYRDIACSICRQHDVAFIDLRQLFLDNRRCSGMCCASGNLTYDGEHPTEKGTRLLASALGNEIMRYLTNRTDQIVVSGKTKSPRSRDKSGEMDRL